MTIITLSIALIILFFLILSLLKHKNSIKVFEELIVKFVEQNQSFYETQQTILKQQKEQYDYLTTELRNLEGLHKHVSHIDNALKGLDRSLHDQFTLTQELKTIMTHIDNVSNNFKILDTVAMTLKDTLKLVKRS